MEACAKVLMTPDNLSARRIAPRMASLVSAPPPKASLARLHPIVSTPIAGGMRQK
jgi:hypothetical protein